VSTARAVMILRSAETPASFASGRDIFSSLRQDRTSEKVWLDQWATSTICRSDHGPFNGLAYACRGTKPPAPRSVRVIGSDPVWQEIGGFRRGAEAQVWIPPWTACSGVPQPTHSGHSASRAYAVRILSALPAFQGGPTAVSKTAMFNNMFGSLPDSAEPAPSNANQLSRP
jgi:hypothetical protein